MMDGGIRSAGLGRKQATARSNDTLQSRAGAEFVTCRASEQSIVDLGRVSCIWADGGNRWQGSGSSWQVGFDSSTISQLLIPASALILGASICITFKYGITVNNLMDKKMNSHLLD